MAIRWRLKAFLTEQRAIHTASGLRKKVIETTGVAISLQNVCNLLNRKPGAIKLKTMEIICTALDCQLSDILEIAPGKIQHSRTKQLSPQNTPTKMKFNKSFPDPMNYE